MLYLFDSRTILPSYYIVGVLALLSRQQRVIHTARAYDISLKVRDVGDGQILAALIGRFDDSNLNKAGPEMVQLLAFRFSLSFNHDSPDT